MLGGMAPLPPQGPQAAGPTPQGLAAPPRYASAALFAGARELYIEHRGEWYRLQITRQERLILTK